ncbi:MAG: hypothetical protein AAGI01_00800, partial [Myxococcota bacterium]
EAVVRFCLYDRDGELKHTLDVGAPIEENIKWITARAEDILTDSSRTLGTYRKAEGAVLASDYERLGTMLHNFTEDSFSDLDSVAQTKLAAGIVGYWSTPEIFMYLIANRNFSLRAFREIQVRVVAQAIEFGIALSEPLRALALSEGMAESEPALVYTLLGNFAEVCAGLKSNDLDDLETYENWEELLEVADELELEPNLEVVELAQASYRRASELEESSDFELEPIEAPRVEDPEPGVVPVPKGSVNLSNYSMVMAGDLVVARRSEATGVTYFLPDDAVLEQFDRAQDMGREDLTRMLDDANGRVEASQVLIGRYGQDVLDDVWRTVEQMNVPEIASLSKFLETHAEGMQDGLVSRLVDAGPSATFITAHALVALGAADAAPALLDALRDPERRGNAELLIRTLAGFGESLTAPIAASIRRDGASDEIVGLMVALERAHEGALTKFSKDRSSKVRDAAKLARKRL